MALNQATNITPSLSGAFSLGNGVVDVTSGMTVSWQVNGPSPLVAYQVTIYLNDAASTQKYTTGKVTLGTPFYGKDALGNFVFFSFNISAAALSTAGITNGGDYKLAIRQWWGNTDAESILQYNASAFITRSAPSVSITTIPSPVTQRKYTFYAAYTQAQGDALNWVRWQIAPYGETGDPLFDSQNIYTSLLSCTYDGFFSGESSSVPNYEIRCQIQTVNGVEADTGWVPFTVYYSTQASTGFVQVKCNGEKDAVWVSWPVLSSIPGSNTGEYQISGGSLYLPLDSSVSWDSVNSGEMDLSAPWSILFKTTVFDVMPEVFLFDVIYQSTLFDFEIGDGHLLFVLNSNDELKITYGGNPICATKNVRMNDEITVILSGGEIYVRIFRNDGALYPAGNLSASDTLYPNDGETIILQTEEYAESLPQENIGSVTINGNQAVDYIQILNGNVESDDLEKAYEAGTYVPIFTGKTYFLADFARDLNAGLLDSGGGNINGYTIYRQRGNERIVRVADVAGDVTELYDYTIRNGRGAYRWSVYAKNNDSFVTDAIESEDLTPCFWDWVLLACEDTGDGYFRVNKVFRFGMNVQTDAISNNNEPGIYKNFTRYPTVMRAPQNYKSGKLQALVGYATDGEYKETFEAKEALAGLSTSGERLFLRSRKGDLLEIMLTAPVSLDTMDESAMQAQTASLQWAEVADAENVSLISFDTNGGNNE